MQRRGYEDVLDARVLGARVRGDEGVDFVLRGGW